MISGEAGYPVILANVTLGERQVDLLIGIDRAEVRAGREELAPFLVFLPVFVAIVGPRLDGFHLLGVAVFPDVEPGARIHTSFDAGLLWFVFALNDRRLLMRMPATVNSLTRWVDRQDALRRWLRPPGRNGVLKWGP